jgi:serine/threonine protein phosphatase PrpC
MGLGSVYLSEPNKTKSSVDGQCGALKYGVTSMQGWRIKMEDAHLAVPKFGGDASAALFAVFDGHGGTSGSHLLGWEVAEYVRRHFPNELLADPNYAVANYPAALEATFLRMDAMLASPAGRKELADITASKLTKPRTPGTAPASAEADGEDPMEVGPEMKGCTANVVLIKNGTLYIANAGDSRAILVTDSGASNLSEDHKPELSSEQARITHAGGAVFNGRVDGNLNLSRALGDLQYKSNGALRPEEQMICALPDVTTRKITHDMLCVVMGCDGIFETKSTQDIGAFVAKGIRESPGIRITATIERLLDSLLSPNYIQTGGCGCDNMTCIVIQFQHF